MITPWAIVPVLNCMDFTRNALTDLLAQTGRGSPLRVLVINQGSTDDTRDALEALAEASQGRILLWSHLPPLPALAATWNRALQFVWSTGATEAWVVNNDVRVHRQTYDVLSKTIESEEALFVSAVGVREGQYDPAVKYDPIAGTREGWLTLPSARGGPDFSCFVITKAGHDRYPFDEGCSPAYFEDNMCHREYLLGGDGGRIFSVNVPYLHFSSRTVNSFTSAEQAAFAKRVANSRQHYERSWGGGVNSERFSRKGDPSSVMEEVTNPDLQRRALAGRFERDAVLRDAPCSATPDSPAPYSGGCDPGDGTRYVLDAGVGNSTPLSGRA